MIEPTSKQCENNEKVSEDKYKVYYACWYPQMGGYTGKAVASFNKNWKEFSSGATMGGCVDMFVWHDGNFPFGSEKEVTELHHCSPEQFIEFGEFLSKINNNLKKN